MWFDDSLRVLNVILVQSQSIVYAGAWIFVAGYFLYRRVLPSTKTLWIIVAALIGFKILEGILFSWLQYYTWKTGGPMQFSLPPYMPLADYFLGYAFRHYFYAHFVSIAASFLLGGIFWIMNRDYENRFMEPNEIPFVVLGGLIVGWPNFMLYLGLALALGIAGWFYARFVRKEAVINLAVPFILASGITLFAGDYLASFLPITRLVI